MFWIERDPWMYKLPSVTMRVSNVLVSGPIQSLLLICMAGLSERRELEPEYDTAMGVLCSSRSSSGIRIVGKLMFCGRFSKVEGWVSAFTLSNLVSRRGQRQQQQPAPPAQRC